jgi:hypothetical protein
MLHLCLTFSFLDLCLVFALIRAGKEHGIVAAIRLSESQCLICIAGVNVSSAQLYAGPCI